MDIFNNSLGITKPNYSLETEVGKIVGLAPTITEIVVLLLILFYIFFAFILTRRVRIMNTNFKTPSAASFSLLASINLLASLVVMVITLLTLIK